MYTHMTYRLPRVKLGLLLLLGLTCGQLLFAQKKSNQPPVALDDSATVVQGQSLVIPVLANDYDPDGDPLSVQNVRQARGVIHVQNDGTLLYQPTPNFVGEDIFEYVIADGNKGKASANVVVLVTAAAANHDPLAIDDNALTEEDTPAVIAVLLNDSDEDGDALVVSSVTQGTGGSVSIEADDSVIYTPGSDFNGTDSFGYTISDGNGGTASATVFLTVSPVNDAPIADDQTVATNEDESIAITLTGSDVDDDHLSFSVTTDPANGQLSGTPPNLTYTPDTNFNGQDSFTFQVSDGQSSDQGAVTISVGADNDPPLAADDAASTDEDTQVTIDVLANDNDPDGDALSVESVTQGSGGSVAINPDGTLTYLPLPDFNGSDNFTYTISDGFGGTDQGVVSITVIAVNDAPMAVDDAASTPEDTPTTIAVLANDSDVDGDPLTIQNVNQANGVVHINPDGTLSYDPTPNFYGIDEFFYTVIDGNGGQATATVIVNVGSENDAPIAVDDAATTNEDAPLTIDVLANDSDPDGDALNITGLTQGTNGSASVSPDGTISYAPNADYNGSDSFSYTISDGNGGAADANVFVTINAVNDVPIADDQIVSTGEDESVGIILTGSDVDGDPLTFSIITGPTSGQLTGTPPSLTYAPITNFNGQDSFTFLASDGQASSQGTVSITIGAFNDPPVAASDNAVTDEDSPVTIDVLSNDSDPEGDALTVVNVTQGSNGTATLNPDGSVIYTPATNFNGSDGLTYFLSDGNGGTAEGAVSVTVNPVNDAPLAVDDAAETAEDTPITIAILANDSDVDGDPLTVQNVTQANGVVHINPDGSLTYSPTPNFSGIDDFFYTVIDGNGGQATASVTVNVISVNDAPIATDDAAATDEDTPVTIDVLANDADPDGDNLSIEGFTQGSNGSVSQNPDGTLTYLPTENYFGSDLFTYTASDGELNSETATVSITIEAVNDPPVITSLAQASATEGELFTYLASATDSDDDAGSTTFSFTNLPVWLAADGASLAGTPGEGDGSTTFTITADDGHAENNLATLEVSLTVQAVNDPPVAHAQQITTDEDVVVAISLSGSDPEGVPLEYELLSDPEHGTLSGDAPDLMYTPNADYYGDDSFTFRVSDGELNSEPAAVTVTVSPVNDLPVAYNQAAITDEDAAVAITLTGSDSEDLPLDYEVLTTPEHGVLSGDDPDLTYTPSTNYFGDDSFTFRVSDGDLNSAPATISITVNPVNDPPMITSPVSASVAEDELFTYTATANDVDDETIEITFSGLPDWVTVDGSTVTGIPGEGVADFVFTVIANDGHEVNNLATLEVQVAVGAVNDPPVAQDLAIDTNEDQDISFELTASDAENDPLTFETLTTPAHGTLKGAAPVLKYTPVRNYFGEDSFTFRVSDGAASDEGVVTITLAPVNDLPVARDDETNTPQNTPVIIDVLANDSDVDNDILTIIGTPIAEHGVVTTNPATTLTYIPSTGYSGTDRFHYTISDGNGGSATATVTIYVNITELAVSDSVGTEGKTIDTGFGAGINIPAGALNTPVNLVISQFAAAPPGVETAGPVYFFGPTGTYFNVPVTITVSYDPDLLPLGLDASRMSLLRYNEGDGTWEVIPATVDSLAHLVIGQTDHFSGFAAGFAPNQAPIVLQQISDAVIPEDSPYATLIQNISDYFADLDEGDHLSFSANSLDEGLETLIISQELSLVAIPVDNFFGEVRIVVSATDDWGVSTSDTLLLTVSSINDAPEFPAGFREALASVMTIQEDQVLRINLMASDVEGDAVTFQVTSDTSAVTVAVAQDTTPVLVVVPEPNWFGTARIGISASDGEAITSLEPVILTVGAINDVPDAFDLLYPGNGDQLFMTSENNEDSLVFEWDAVIDPDGDPVSYTFVFSDSTGVNWEYGGLESNALSIAYADIATAIRALGLNSVSFWWSVVAQAGADTVQASQGPFRLFIDTGTLSVEDGSHLPEFFALHQNYPNPFNPVTTIRFEVPRASHVLLVIYDMRGREVIRLVDEYTPPGYNKVIWNSSDTYGRPVPSGVYIARMIAEDYTRVIKMTIIR